MHTRRTIAATVLGLSIAALGGTAAFAASNDTDCVKPATAQTASAEGRGKPPSDDPTTTTTSSTTTAPEPPPSTTTTTLVPTLPKPPKVPVCGDGLCSVGEHRLTCYADCWRNNLTPFPNIPPRTTP